MRKARLRRSFFYTFANDMKKSILTLVLLLALLPAGAQVERPRLVVGLVVDQMRWDYLYYYYNDYRADGIKRLLGDGFSVANTQINYSPAVTAIGHTSIYTGSVPALHGIAGNWFWKDGNPTYCCTDTTVKSVGSNSKEGQMSPRNMLGTTIGDELRLATNFKSKVIGVALKDRASILPAGHSANAAYWWDTSAGHFVSSTFYMDKLPEWVMEFNKANHTKPGFNIKTNDDGVTMTFRMAEAALKNEKLGQTPGETDMLTVSISSTDAIGHEYSTRGPEIKSVYMRLDRDLATFLTTLDNTVGKGNYLLFLTADHGASHNYNFMKQHRIPADGWAYDKTVADMNKYLRSAFTTLTADPVLGEDNYHFYLNDNAFATGEKQRIIDAAIQWLKRDPQFLWVVDNEKIAMSNVPEPIKSRLINGIAPHRSGEITVVTRPQVFGATVSPSYKGTTHGQPMAYDIHIPLVFYGWHVKNGETNIPANITDIAPTVCAMLHIQMPDAAVGKPIIQLTDDNNK